jgi:PAS domain S-box-containing protein
MPTETLFEELQRYTGFTEVDVARLHAFHAVAAPRFPAIAQAFYDQTREHEEAHAVFKDEAQIARLQSALVQWMHRVCTGPYDHAYYEETSKIGRIHVRVGLPQRYMFSAMALIRMEFDRIVDAYLPEVGTATRQTIARILHIELALMLETYASSSVARAQRHEMQAKEELRGALARTEHRYVNAVEFATLLIVGLDAAGTIRLYNGEAERRTGLGRDEVDGQRFVDVLVAEDLRAEQEPVIVAALTGQRKRETLDSAFLSAAGKRRHVRWQLAHVPPAAGDDIVLFALGEDTTEELVALERIRQQEKLAAVGMLAAGLAHEIRNPLNGAQLHIAFLERALRRSGADADSCEAVKVVEEEIKRLSALVTEFLDFARPNPLCLAPVDLRVLSERALQIAAADAEQAHVVLIRDFAPKAIVVDVDRGRIEQVLLNLVRNAIEALGPSGGGRVTLRVRLKPRWGMIEVEDDGPGLPANEAPIFDAFFSTKPSGTGLGLAIVHRIVTDHRGTIDFESMPGRTLFRVGLPIGEPG